MSEPPPRTESELVEFVRSSDVRAPEELHRRVQALVDADSPPARRRLGRDSAGAGGRSRLSLGLAGAFALVAVAVVVSLSGGGAHTLTLHQTSQLTLSAPNAPAPAASTSNRGQLAADVDGIPFPYWEDHFGWRSTGTRSDRIGGRTVTTVFYADGQGRRLGYAIVGGTPAPTLSGGTVVWHDGVPYRLLSYNGAHVIAWLRNGHLCVVAGRGVDGATLLRLASWT
jgi:hypothetical protein